MAPVYQEISLAWNGKDYTITPTYALIQRLEQRLSLAALLSRALGGSPPLSQLADLLAEVLQAAGCKDDDATAEEINAELYDEHNAAILTKAAINVLLALLPQKVSRGNVKAPAKGATSSEISPGPSTTRSPSDTSGSNQANSGE